LYCSYKLIQGTDYVYSKQNMLTTFIKHREYVLHIRKSPILHLENSSYYYDM